MCMAGDDDYWEFFTTHHPKARQDHRCVECHRTIHKGERYWTMGGLNDGNFIWHKLCEHCEAATGWLIAVCDGYLFTRTEEDFLEHVVGHEKYIRSLPLTRLVRWMRADWRDRAGNLRPVEHVESLAALAVAAWYRQVDRERQGLRAA